MRSHVIPLFEDQEDEASMSVLDAGSLTAVMKHSNGHEDSRGSLSSCVNIERDHDLLSVNQSFSNRAEASDEGNHVDPKDPTRQEDLETTRGNQVYADNDVLGTQQGQVPESMTSTSFFLQQRKTAIQSMMKYLESLPPDQSFRKEMTDYQFWKSVRAEFLATLLFVIFTTNLTLETQQTFRSQTTSNLLLQQHNQNNKSYQVALNNGDMPVPASSLIIGFVTAALMYMTSNRIKKYRSCHLNPCLTLALFVTRHHDDHKHRHVSLPKMLLFVGVQLLASIVASVILFGLTFSHSSEQIVSEGNQQQMHLTSRTNNYNNITFSSYTTTTTFCSLSVPTPVQGLPASNLFGLEFLSSFIVILVYFSVTDPSSFKQTRCSRRHNKDRSLRSFSRIKKRDFENRNEVETRTMQENQEACTVNLNEVRLRDENARDQLKEQLEEQPEERTQHDVRTQSQEDTTDLEASFRNNDTPRICHDGQNHNQSSYSRPEDSLVREGGEEAEKECLRKQRYDGHLHRNSQPEDDMDSCLRSRKKNTTRNDRDSKSVFCDSHDRKMLLTRNPESEEEYYYSSLFEKKNNNMHYCFAFVGFAITAAHLFSVRVV